MPDIKSAVSKTPIEKEDNTCLQNNARAKASQYHEVVIGASPEYSGQ
jgi:hypothetical protein